MQIKLTRVAAERAQNLRAAHGLGSDVGLRLAVDPAQSGAQRFALALDEGPGPRDRSWQQHGVAIFCDARSYLYLGDVEIDWNEERGGFWIRESPRVRT